MAAPSTLQGACTPKEVLSLLHLVPPTSVPMLWGPPGVGKSTMVRDFAKANGMRFVSVPLHSMEATDFVGLPTFTGSFSTYAVPRWLWQLTEAAERGEVGQEEDSGRKETGRPGPRRKGCLLFLDELPQARPDVMHAVSALILDRTVGVGGLPLAHDVQIVAAGNRTTDAAYTAPLGTHLRSRLIHMTVAVSLEDWREYARQRGLEPRVIAFLSASRRWLHAFDPKRKEEPFPCPRSWEVVSRILSHAATAGGVDNRALEPLVAGAVGMAAASEFLAFLESADLCPTAEQIVANPDDVALPEGRPDLSLLVVENLVMACRENWVHFTDGTLRFAGKLSGEMRSVLMTALLKEEGPATMKEAVLSSPHYAALSKDVARSHRLTVAFDRVLDA